ncbi:MAG: TIM-barrel domain-containing protein [Candidatus Kryptoniota bacterium]
MYQKLREHLFTFVCLLLFISQTNAAANDYKIKDQTVSIKTSTTVFNIEVFNPKIIRIVKFPSGSPESKISLSVIKVPEETKFKIYERKGIINVTTLSLKICLTIGTGLIAFYDLKGHQLLREAETPAMFVPTPDADKKTFAVKQYFKLSSDEGIYGLGQDQNGVMNYRNHEVLLKQSNMHVANPFMLSTKGYGLLWDNYSASYFSDDSSGTLFESEIGDCIDYYFVYGPTPDSVIASYRDLTGQSPMFCKWAFGFWQSRERYTSQDEIVGVVEKYRSLRVPLDNIVQDWRYWGETENWNSTEFGDSSFPNPKEMIEKLHNDNVHIMISVWPSFGENTAIYTELKEKKLLYDFITFPPEGGGVRVYDAFNPLAREIYWKYMNKNLFSIGIDAWWLDATEPEQQDRQGKIDSTITFLGSFKRFRNAFPLETCRGVYDNQRRTSSNKRVFILTRSAFAGQQRYSASNWSGDIDGTWNVFRRQISGGLNFCMSGIPYWTTDIGGFYVRNDAYPQGVANPSYQELYVRWFQFGAFCPLFRSHGTSTPREIYNFGSKGYWAFDAQEKFLNLRYRLMPYIYTLAWKVTHEAYTMMRGLPMDFADDPKVLAIDNQYMFGPSILVCPVTEPQYTTQAEDGTQIGTTDLSTIHSTQVYLPQCSGWFNFWTGEKIDGGQEWSCKTPIDIMPLFVKAGSIIPFGPYLQYAEEKPADPIELRIYTGADATFELYEDENDNYDYEKGIYAVIPLKWDDKSQTLTIGKREGSFPGMKKERTFNIVFVKENHGVGVDIEKQPDKTVQYKGNRIVIQK